ncbi:MAG TPA: ATP-binding protein [Candidatus Methylacidiphilales bacterium]|jgi:signal transduction histidine kinase|nr:ATP-binding protein [Candidatus Methylacidiphilales bacterium]
MIPNPSSTSLTEIRLSSSDKSRSRQKLISGALCFLCLLAIGIIDYVTGYEISVLVFYAIPIGLAAIYVSVGYALLLSIAAIALSRVTDFLSGMPYPGHAVFFSNCVIPLAFFGIVVASLYLLNQIRRGLESTVEQRNRALLQEMHERGRLERQVIELSEREHRRFGQELHELVTHELAAIAIDAHLLTRNLLAAGDEEVGRAREIALKVDRALTKARNIARGYFTLGFDAAGFAEALREIASRTQKATRISCLVHCADDLAIGNEDATIQLFRIAQEALQNAARHAEATRIITTFERRDDHFWLVVEDNGKGLAPTNGKDTKPPRKEKGLGLSIMAYRAGLIGGKFLTERSLSGGTRVICTVPAAKLTRQIATVAA